MTTTSLPHAALLLRLTREWQAIRHRPAVLRRAHGWQVGVDFQSLDELVDAAGFRRDSSAGRHPADGDAVLARLLLAARQDDLAARVVLQRILPGLVATARRWARRPEGGPEALDELLAAAWAVIRTFPVERREAQLAARLLRESQYHAFVRPHRRLLVLEPVPGERLDVPVTPLDDTPPAEELAELIAASHTLSERDRELLALIVDGCSVGEVAAALQVSVRTVTNHRDAMVSRLRQTARALAAA
jgi:DNA-directed RNA polymerase specialized sigma24 family protein